MEKELFLHLRETDGKPASLDLTNLFNIEKTKNLLRLMSWKKNKTIIREN